MNIDLVIICIKANRRNYPIIAFQDIMNLCKSLNELLKALQNILIAYKFE
jgi:hypothetical protein